MLWEARDPHKGRIKALISKDNTKSNGEDTDTYYNSERWSLMSSGKSVQSKGIGDLGKEEIYFRKKDVRTVPRRCLIGNGLREGQWPSHLLPNQGPVA